ncbi:MAG: hypothetical protein KKE79_03790 [Actinobacteria bacterium]|nr:hypothetical protein [Actinomycetota bacterium]
MAYEKKHRKRSKRRKKKEEAAEAGSETGLTPEEAGRRVYPAPEPPMIHGIDGQPGAPVERKASPRVPPPVPGAPQQPPARPPSRKRRKAEPAAAAPAEKGRAEPAGRPAPPPPVVNEVGKSPVSPAPPTGESAGEGTVAAHPPEAGTEADETGRPREPASPEAAMQQPPGFQGYGYYPPQPAWYPAVYPPPQFYGYPPGYQQGPPVEVGEGRQPDEQTGPIPVVPQQPPVPVIPPSLYPPAFLPPGGGVCQLPPGVPLSPFQPIEDAGFEELTRAESTHWRVDIKWVFGILTTLLLFMTITTAGLHRISGQGAAREIMVPVIDDATGVRSAVEENYQDLKVKARKKNAQLVIPDIGVDISIGAEEILSLGSEELADRVVLEVGRQTYNQGYYSDLPMKPAQGVGEERGKATCETLLASLNRKTHQALVWPMIILGVMALLFAAPFLIFCRGWGKVIGAGVVVIAAALPASLYIRIGCQFLWKGGAAGLYKGAVLQAFSTSGSLMLVYFDIALGVGALLLLMGIVGNTVSRKSRERVLPFGDLQEPAEIVAGGPAVEPGPILPPTPPDEPARGTSEEAFLD